MPEPLMVLAAGSLRAILGDYATTIVPPPRLVFGPAGLLRRQIEAGRSCDVYLSANQAHPAALAQQAGATSRAFARNPLRVVTRLGARVTPGTLLDHMLDPATRLGTSTRGADPSGDYAHEMFARADAMRAGAGAALRAKAIAVVGAAVPAPDAPTKEPGVAGLFRVGRIDAFVGYRTSAALLAGAHDVVVPPPGLAVTAIYALVVLRPGAGAEDFADGLLGATGAALLARHGFDPA